MQGKVLNLHVFYVFDYHLGLAQALQFSLSVRKVDLNLSCTNSPSARHFVVQHLLLHLGRSQRKVNLTSRRMFLPSVIEVHCY